MVEARSPARGRVPTVRRGEDGDSRRSLPRLGTARPQPLAGRRRQWWRRQWSAREAQPEDGRHRCGGARTEVVGGACPSLARRDPNPLQGDGNSGDGGSGRRDKPSLRTSASGAAGWGRGSSAERGSAWLGETPTPYGETATVVAAAVVDARSPAAQGRAPTVMRGEEGDVGGAWPSLARRGPAQARRSTEPPRPRAKPRADQIDARGPT